MKKIIMYLLLLCVCIAAVSAATVPKQTVWSLTDEQIKNQIDFSRGQIYISTATVTINRTGIMMNRTVEKDLVIPYSYTDVQNKGTAYQTVIINTSFNVSMSRLRQCVSEYSYFGCKQYLIVNPYVQKRNETIQSIITKIRNDQKTKNTLNTQTLINDLGVLQ